MIKTFLLTIFVLFLGVTSVQAETCAVGKTFHGDQCTCPEGSKMTREGASAYYKCVPVQKMCELNKSVFLGDYCGSNAPRANCCTCPSGSAWTMVSNGYGQCK